MSTANIKQINMYDYRLVILFSASYIALVFFI